MLVSLVAAIDRKHAIGRDGKLPWRLKNDLKHFKEITNKGIVIMGRKTFESIPGGPLPNRHNVVISSRSVYSYKPPGVTIRHSIHEVLDMYRSTSELFIIGGQQVYEQFLPYANRMYLTIVHTEIENADVWFSKFDAKDWQVVSDYNYHPVDDENEYAHSFVEIRRGGGF